MKGGALEWKVLRDREFTLTDDLLMMPSVKTWRKVGRERELLSISRRPAKDVGGRKGTNCRDVVSVRRPEAKLLIHVEQRAKYRGEERR